MLSNELSRRIEQFGYDPKFFTHEGEEFALRFVKKIEDSAALFRQWFPRLQAFEQKCRKNNPLPEFDDLSSSEQAMYTLYQRKINELERLTDKNPYQATIFSFSLICLLAARELWPSQINNGIQLTPDELGRWGEIYSHPEEEFWWFTNYWCSIDNSLRNDEMLESVSFVPQKRDKEHWIVTTGLIWGPMAGGETSEHWEWDGQDPRFVEHISCTSF